jgi:hypothetical protein
MKPVKFITRILLAIVLSTCITTAFGPSSGSAVHVHKSRKGNRYRVVEIDTAREFAAMCLKRDPDDIDIKEAYKLERLIGRGKEGAQIFKVKVGRKQYVVKSSQKGKEFRASKLMQETMLGADEMDLGNLEVLYPTKFCVCDTLTQEVDQYTDIEEDDDANVNLAANQALLQFMPFLEGRMILGDVWDDEDFLVDVPQLYELGRMLGMAVANLHGMGYEGDGISRTIHGDMHPGQAFFQWDPEGRVFLDDRVTFIDFDRMGRESVVVDFYRLIGETMRELDTTDRYEMIAYIWGFLMGYRAVLPDALDLNYDDKFIELFSTESQHTGSVMAAALMLFFKPLKRLPSRMLAASTMDAWRVMCTNLSHARKVKGLQCTGLEDRYELVLPVAELIHKYFVAEVAEEEDTAEQMILSLQRCITLLNRSARRDSEAKKLERLKTLLEEEFAPSSEDDEAEEDDETE